MDSNKPLIPGDPWAALKAATPARIGLGGLGSTLPLNEFLRLKAAQAQARDAVKDSLDPNVTAALLTDLGLDCIHLESRAVDRETYLLRPDLGRRLDPASAEILRQRRVEPGPDLVIILADGLSAKAVEENAGPVLETTCSQLRQTGWTIGPAAVVTGGRVAVADEIGQLLGATLTAVLIGERPGLTSPRSMSIYFTYRPMIGLTDERRNCISNIHAQGLTPDRAAVVLVRLLSESRRLKISGVELKDQSDRGEITTG